MRHDDREYEYRYRAGTGRIVRIVVRAISVHIANHLCRKELAIRFRGKTYKKIEGPIPISLKDHIM